MKFLFLVFFLAANCFAQTDWVKWGKKDVPYVIHNENNQRDYSINSDNPVNFLTKSLVNVYWYFVSDVDGDNCSFNPTCSSFFIQSVKKTNIFQGTLMFFDRFTRDMNIFNKKSLYPILPDGHFYDPPSLYTLNNNKIKYLPPTYIEYKK